MLHFPLKWLASDGLSRGDSAARRTERLMHEFPPHFLPGKYDCWRWHAATSLPRWSPLRPWRGRATSSPNRFQTGLLQTVNNAIYARKGEFRTLSNCEPRGGGGGDTSEMWRPVMVYERCLPPMRGGCSACPRGSAAGCVTVERDGRGETPGVTGCPLNDASRRFVAASRQVRG